ncbi:MULTISPECIES: MFS transporter [unclassified Sphingomonas]|uniref:MFS transporter n=1 Tax=unclassified Sphingomonas TaxID=196159 RepID=UPI000BDD1F9D|nr:MAG: MFS transporter [Sphingomonas sp. 12-62-6]OYX38899.1 MAG: MFS transporter [Sphingomonas sp. 32-62-10]
MLNALGLLKERRFLPLFVTQFLGAFNDNLFKTSMVLFATYQIYNDPTVEQNFNALATAIGILPFFLLSALAGQLADTHDKARIIRIVKTAEILIMIVGSAGLLIAHGGYATPGLALMLVAVLGLGIHSAFFGPIKYAILPQHLHEDEVLGGTGMVEAATYLAILSGTVVAGVLATFPAEITVATVIAVALIGWVMALFVPPALRQGPELTVNFNPFTSSWRVISATMHIPRLFMTICAISFFWSMGAVLIIIFPPLVKNVLTANEAVSTFVIALFSIGVAIGSVAINALLRGHTSARYAPGSVLAMGGCIIIFSLLCRAWPAAPAGTLYDLMTFIEMPRGIMIVIALMAIAITGGMFVVPLYAFLTTTVTKDQTARTVAANNVVNAGAMVIGALGVQALAFAGVGPGDMLFVVAAMCPISAWLGHKLHLVCDQPLPHH